MLVAFFVAIIARYTPREYVLVTWNRFNENSLLAFAEHFQNGKDRSGCTACTIVIIWIYCLLMKYLTQMFSKKTEEQIRVFSYA